MATTQTSTQPPAAGSLAHTEFATTDPKGTRKFLEKVFGWKFQAAPMPQGEYFMFEGPGGTRGGVRGTQKAETPSVTNYINVDDLADAQKRIEKAGGRIVLPRVDIPGMGSFFWFQAPGGPVLACWQSARA